MQVRTLSILFTLLAVELWAQDFRPGFIITSQADTVRGKVQRQTNKKAQAVCKFRDANGKTTSFGPSDIAGYGIDGETAFTSIVLSSKDGTQRTTFAEVIVVGKISLFRDHYGYLVFKEDSITVLEDNKFVVEIGGKSFPTSDKKYQKDLKALMADCPSAQERLHTISLSEKPLTKVVHAYNMCSGGPSRIGKESLKWFSVGIGLAAGLNSSNLSVKVGSQPYVDGSFETSNTPLLALAFDFESPRATLRISGHGEIQYLRSDYKNFSLRTVGISTTRDYVLVKFEQLRFPIGLKYSLSFNSFRSYVNAGVSPSALLSHESTYTREVALPAFVSAMALTPANINSIAVGIWGGIGFAIPVRNNLSAFAEVRYEHIKGNYSHESSFPGTGYIFTTVNDYTISNLQFTAGIRFR